MHLDDNFLSNVVTILTDITFFNKGGLRHFYLIRARHNLELTTKGLYFFFVLCCPSFRQKKQTNKREFVRKWSRR